MRLTGPMPVRIQANALQPQSVHVTDADTGQTIEHLLAVEYHAQAGEVPRARLIFFASTDVVSLAPALDVTVAAEPVLVPGVELLAKLGRWLRAHAGQTLDEELIAETVNSLADILAHKDG